MAVKTNALKISQRIFFIRQQKVIFDFDLASLYGVETRALKQAVKRNKDRLPKDFMFMLNSTEVKNMVSQTVIPSKSYLGGAAPMVFTEQGVAMLSSILKSQQAVRVNIGIMRAFVQMREMMNSNKELAGKIAELEKKYDGQFKIVFDSIRGLIYERRKPRERIGFRKDQI